MRRDDAGDMHFSELSPLLFRLLQLLDDEAVASGRDALMALSTEAAVDADTFVREGTAMLQRLRQEGTVLGTM